MLHLQILHESIARFNENFASFLYGLNMSAFCVDFPEAPGAESFRRTREQQGHGGGGRSGFGYGYGQRPGQEPGQQVTFATETGLGGGRGRDVDATFL